MAVLQCLCRGEVQSCRSCGEDWFQSRIQIPVQASAIIAEGLNRDGGILGTSPSADVMMVKQWPFEGSGGHDEL